MAAYKTLIRLCRTGPLFIQGVLGIARLFTNGDQFLHQLAKPPIFGDLLPSPIDRASGGDDLGNRFSPTGMKSVSSRAVSWGVFLGTVTVRLATPAKAGGERTAPEIVDLSQTGFELFAPLLKSLHRNGHGVPPCLTT